MAAKFRESWGTQVERKQAEFIITDSEEIRLIGLHRAKKKRGRGDLTLFYRKARIVKHRWQEDEEWQERNLQLAAHQRS